MKRSIFGLVPLLCALGSVACGGADGEETGASASSVTSAAAIPEEALGLWEAQSLPADGDVALLYVARVSLGDPAVAYAALVKRTSLFGVVRYDVVTGDASGDARTLVVAGSTLAIADGLLSRGAQTWRRGYGLNCKERDDTGVVQVGGTKLTAFNFSAVQTGAYPAAIGRGDPRTLGGAEPFVFATTSGPSLTLEIPFRSLNDSRFEGTLRYATGAPVTDCVHTPAWRQ